jgi:Serine dehydrogenase proteinase
MGADSIPEIMDQLRALPKEAKALDFMVISAGGDPMAAWRIVRLIRERVEKFSVLVPQAAFSAATLLALGADEIVMHPFGNLGPVDAQITVKKGGPNGEGPAEMRFGFEDMAALVDYARNDVGLTDQKHLSDIFHDFTSSVGPIPVAVAARSARLTLSLGERLLRTHMQDEQKSKTIAEVLSRKFYNHGHAVSRKEAQEIGLAVAESNEAVEDLMWEVWQDLESEMKTRVPFNAAFELAANPAAAAVLFAPTQQLQVPANLPPQVMQNVLNQVLNGPPVVGVPPTDFEFIGAVIESPRLRRKLVAAGKILASRLPDNNIALSVFSTKQAWETFT